jgi:uncharacterized protein (DUF927 family)
MRDNDNISVVAAAALAAFDSVMAELNLAGGKNQGREYLPVNPKRLDHKPGSFSINRESGAWQDFATGDKGGDLVSLAAYLWTCRQLVAAKRLAGFLGVPDTAKSDRTGTPPGAERGGGVTNASTTSKKDASGTPRAPTDVCVMPVPADALAPPAAHARHGKPAHRWAYTSATGETCFYHDRYEPKGERKQFAPLSLWRRPDGGLYWKFAAPPAPRILLGLADLTAKPDRAAVLVEGEKARDAAALLLPDHPICCWQGGAQAVGKADFAALAGREVWLWPDNDEPGQHAMRAARAALAAVNAGPVKTFNVSLFAQCASVLEDGLPQLAPGGEWNPGDDAADLLARGWTAVHLAAMLQARADLLVAVESSAIAKPSTGNAEASARRFELTDRGVIFHEPDKSPRWICAPVRVTAQVRDPHNRGWALLLEFSDPDRNPHIVIVPMSLFRADGVEVAGLLLDHGLKIAPKGKPMLLEYLITARTSKRARVTSRTGWHDAGPDGAVFVLPDDAIGPTGDAWIFESNASGGQTFAMRGTLKGWQREVSALCSGNSRLLFAVSVAFAAPLLYLAGAEGGGFHFRSNSSDGKTTALRIAASVCGGPEYMQRWRATDNGLEALAPQHCDAPLLLDELAQIDPKAAGEVAYMLANGGGKARADRMGGMRERASWRILFLSAGEIGLTEQMGKIGSTPHAGQELRLAEIPADAGDGMGVFEQLHEFKSGGEFAKALNEAARRQYGTAFIVWLRELATRQQDVGDEVREAQRQFERTCLSAGAHGQARRVAGRFALVGAGGELATKWGITGWQVGEAMQAARTCFEAWLSRRGGEGNQEEYVILAQVREFLRRYGESAFTDWERPANDTDKHAPVRSDRAGYRRRDPVADVSEYFIFNEVFRTRVCKGLDHGAAGRLLLAREFIEQGKERDRPWLVKEKLPAEGRARVVHILPAIWDGEDD